jgi:hypothetical protein
MTAIAKSNGKHRYEDRIYRPLHGEGRRDGQGERASSNTPILSSYIPLFLHVTPRIPLAQMAGTPSSQQAADKARAQITQKSALRTTPRSRIPSSAEPGHPSAEDLLHDPSQAVKDVDSAKSYLIGSQYLAPTVDITVSQLVSVLATLATDRSVNKQTSSVIRAVALLLQTQDILSQSILISAAVCDRVEPSLRSTKMTMMPYTRCQWTSRTK